jgi:bifunctional DNase/RNase
MPRRCYMPHVKVEIDAIRRPELEKLHNQAILILKEKETEHYLPIWLSSAQADILATELQGLPLEQRTAPGLFLNSVNAACSDIICVTVHFDKDIFYAKVLIYPKDEPLEVKCPFGVAIALAYRAQVPILVSSEIMNKWSLALNWEWTWGASNSIIKAAAMN